MEKYLWEKFLKSGKIKDYMKYKESKKSVDLRAINPILATYL